MINEYFPFRESCATKNIDYMLKRMGVDDKSTGIDAVDAIDESDSVYEISSDEENAFSERDLGSRGAHCGKGASIMCITVTDSESDGEGPIADLPQQADFGDHTYAKKYSEMNNTGGWQEIVLQQHREKNTGAKQSSNVKKSNQIKCAQCRVFFESQDAIEYHTTQYHAEGIKRTIQCYLCKRTFLTRSKFSCHMTAIHSHRERFKRPFANRSKVDYPQDFKTKHSNTKLPSANGKQLAIVNDRAQEPSFRQNLNENLLTICPLRRCNEVLENQDSLEYHMRNNHGKRRKGRNFFECHLCGKPSPTLTILKLHMAKDHIPRVRIKCSYPTCRTIFTLRSSLIRHTKTEHTTELVVGCRLCPKEFLSRMRRNEHMRREHPGHLMCLCPIAGCSREFRFPQEIEDHMRYRHDIWDGLVCPVCQKRYSTEQTLKNHTCKERHNHQPRIGTSVQAIHAAGARS